jgi:hypothetical protein
MKCRSTSTQAMRRIGEKNMVTVVVSSEKN